MNIILFVSYILTIIAIIATPGPNALLMASHSMKYGKRASILNATGSACAAAILIILALFGIKKAIPNEFMPVLAFSGACYLVYIGIKNIAKKSDIENSLSEKSNNGFFVESFLTGVSNPKDILFFVLFLPQFIDKSIDFNYSAILLIFGWVFCDLFIMSSYGLLARKAGDIFPSSLLNKITKSIGFFILLIGIILLLSSIKAIKEFV